MRRRLLRLAVHAGRLGYPRFGSVSEAWFSGLLLPVLFVALVYSAGFLLSDLRLFAEPLQAAVDRRMAIAADSSKDTGITFLDFNDATVAARGDPVLIAPKDIAAVLSRLAQTRPRAILLDLDLSYVRDGADLALLRKAFVALDKQSVPVLLARDELPAFDDQPTRYRDTPLDSDVSRSRNMLWVGVVPSGTDNVVRYMPAVQAAHSGGRARYLPTPPLALDLVSRSVSAKDGRTAFEEGMSGQARCAPKRPDHWLFCIQRKHVAVARTPGELIDFTIEWPRVGDGLPVVSALPLIEGQPFNPHVFEKRVVIVGTSAGRRDRAVTPIGEMPGAIVHANALRSWASRGPGYAPAFWPGLLVAIAMTLLVAVAIIFLIRALPEKWDPIARGCAPPFVTSLFWFAFYVAPLAGTAGLVLVVYIATTLITFGERRLEGAEKRQSLKGGRHL